VKIPASDEFAVALTWFTIVEDRPGAICYAIVLFYFILVANFLLRNLRIYILDRFSPNFRNMVDISW